MVDRIVSLVVALSLALLVWLYARSRDQEILDNVPIPVQISLPSGQTDHYLLEVTGPSQVTMSFTGPSSRIHELRGMLQRGEMEIHVTVSVPDDVQEDGHYLDHYLDTVRIDAADVHAPPGVSPVVIEGRNRIPITLFRLVERRLPVRIDQPLEDRGGQVTLEPGSVLVHGPQEVLDKAFCIATQPFSLPPHGDGSWQQPALSIGPVPLVTEIDGRPVRATPAAVMVRLTPRPRLYEINASVQFLCPANFALRPRFIGDSRAAEITLHLTGPELAEEPKVFAFIDLTSGSHRAGMNQGAITLQLPRHFKLAQEPPPPVTFELVPAESPRKDQGLIPGQ
jgi:hypothetical protein